MTRRKFLSFAAALPVVGTALAALRPAEPEFAPVDDWDELVGRWRDFSHIRFPGVPINYLSQIEIMENCHYENGFLVKTDPRKPMRLQTRTMKL
jgi:hypothetical protein